MTQSNQQLRTAVCALLSILSSRAFAEDGSRLWLRYDPLQATERRRFAPYATELVRDAKGSESSAAMAELSNDLGGLLARRVPVSRKIDRDGAILLALGTSASAQQLHLRTDDLGSEGYRIRSARLNGSHATLIVANTEAGLTYGAFAFLRRIQMHRQIRAIDVRDRPTLKLRMLDHWDNLDGTVERGYAGDSIWDWKRLPDVRDHRYIDYARANASIGINATVLNNVNADPRILSPRYLSKVAALAGVFRPYGIRVFLSVRFSSPIDSGGLPTADPLDTATRKWWRDKVAEIYRLIPDFGGFLVKANSEGQSGPQDYHRTHADGANVIAEALEPHGGTVIWRAFVYGSTDQDRAAQAYNEFRPLDGQFRDNVILQVKNGPIDFQPREPFHPLFGQMPNTRIAFEAQVTREYLGQNIGVVYLAPSWTEALASDTCAAHCGIPVAATLAAMAGVSNIGADRNWTGTIFDEANWYALGRLAWNPVLTPDDIANEWTRLTWTNDARAVRPIVQMMLASHENAVNFMTPLGLGHQMATDHHYGPAPWVCDLKQASWNPCYYSRADKSGIGFDRVSGPTSSVTNYMPPVAGRFSDLSSVPDKYLLWFHHVPWTYRMRSGQTLWTELVKHYDDGVSGVSEMVAAWNQVRPLVDHRRWQEVEQDLRREQAEALWWRDASVAYWQSLSELPLPSGRKKPAHRLNYYKALKPPGLPGQKP